MSQVDPADCRQRERELTRDRETVLKAVLRDSPLRETNEVRATILRPRGSECREGAIRLTHWLGFRYAMPRPLLRQGDAEGCQVFIRKYERLMRDMYPDATLIFADAVHPEYRNRPAHDWFVRAERPPPEPRLAGRGRSCTERWTWRG